MTPANFWCRLYTRFGVRVATDETAASALPEGAAADSRTCDAAVENVTTPDSGEPGVQAEEDQSDDEDGDSAGEWVTPENIRHFGIGAQPTNDVPTNDVKVTCATADYSVQNVLLQMGITPLTFDGYAVRTVKLWGLICRACFHFSRDTEKIFCAKCGHDTVVRVPIIVDEKGQPTVLNSGRPLRKKGTVFSMPKPQGGRGWKPIFAEDELRIGGRDRELRHARNISEKERQAKDPFNIDNGARAWDQRSSVNGRPVGTSGPRVQAGYGRRTNPNANNFKGFARKKR